MSEIQRPADYGFFGPDSVTWKVYRHPSSFTVGFQRTVVTEVYEPFLLASVADTGAVMNRPALRYARTLQYAATLVFGDSPSVLKASDTLMRVHQHIHGHEPLSGLTYDANDPDAQLWIHLTQWHSVLRCYEVFGPGPLSPAEELEYWADCRRAAAFQTIDPDTVPANRDQMRAYYERMRPHLAATETTQITIEHILNATDKLFGDLPPALRPVARVGSDLMRRATIATLPHWMRKIGGLRQTRAEDIAAVAGMRAALAAVAAVPGLELAFVRRGSAGAARVMGPVLEGIDPVAPVVREPAAAWAAYGRPTPREQRLALLATRTEQAKAPVDRGAAALVPLA